VDALPPAPPSTPPALSAPAYPTVAPGDIYPRTGRERDLCRLASHPDWFYLGGLLALDAGAIAYGSSYRVKWEDVRQDAATVTFRLSGPFAIGLAWGATIGGGYLALPKCSPEWVGETPREGIVRENWPIAISLALLAGATAPIINAVAIGYTLPTPWSDAERVMHLVTAGVAGFGGALLPYLLPPTTASAAREIDKIRFGTDGHSLFLGYSTAF
jgi:hypothetical protein